ncbi:MAG: YlxR family protein [Synergistaceae bacterium]|nr:YlxR family protein [Synergistaceae bacterium]
MAKSSNKHIPLRICAICRVRGSKYNLIRIVKSPDNKPVIDISGKLPGRGVYICPDSECIELAKKSGGLAHALGLRNIDSDSEFWLELENYAKSFDDTNLADKRLRAVIGLSRKAGALLIGVDNIKNFTHKVLVIIANDCSEGVRNFAGNYKTLTPSISIQELSEAAGSRGVQIIALPLSSGFAKKILNLTQQLSSKNFEGSNAFE